MGAGISNLLMLKTGLDYKREINFHSVIWCCLYVTQLPGSVKNLKTENSVILSLDLKEVTSPVSQLNNHVW